MGYNGAPSGEPHCEEGVNCFPDQVCERTIHAEANCLSFAARSGIKTSGSLLYTTSSPCLNCAQLLKQAGICTIFYEEVYNADVLKTIEPWFLVCEQLELPDHPEEWGEEVEIEDNEE